VLVCGVDEAGRGSLLGPLVIAGVSIQHTKLKLLSSMGIRDSKKLSPSAREILYKKIIEFADNYTVARIYPNVIDSSVRKHKLNFLEAKYMAKVIRELKPSITYVDSCDVNPKRFGKQISKLSNNSKIHSHHKADDKFVIVSAASIIAKVTRDKSIARLQKEHDLGSGYPSDSKTINFVSDCVSNGKDVPSFVRKSWKTFKKLIN